MIFINVFVLKFKHLAAITLLLVLAVMFIATGSTTVFKSGNRNLPVYSVEVSEPKAAVTFNCAWGNEDIETILSTLERYEVKATFFIVGDWAEKYPESVKMIADAGHEIGGHSYNHKDYTKLPSDQITDDLRKNDEAIQKACGITPVLFRVPSGSYNNNVIEVIEASGKVCIQWSTDSIDYNDAEAEDIFKRSSKLEKGGILLMHTGTKNTALALTRILDNLKGKYDLVKVSDLLYKDNFQVDATGKMIKR